MPKVSELMFVGVDPGASGGLAVICSALNAASFVKMPETDRDIWDWIRTKTGRAIIEKVGGYVGGEGQPGSAMFNFGRSYGLLRMALTVAEIPFEEVTPQKWQKALGIVPRKKDESKTSFKNRLKAKAQQLFPLYASRITLSTCDALLIAEYCRRTNA